MTILVIDGQGGGIGKSLVERLRQEVEGARILAVGTNAMATAAMLKAGAHGGATGENAVVCCCAKADLVMGPMGIVLTDAMMGEITGTIANAVACCPAGKILIPVSKCQVQVAGVEQKGLGQYIEDGVRLAREMVREKSGGAKG